MSVLLPILIGMALWALGAWLASRLGTHTLAGAAVVAASFILATVGGGWIWGALVLLYFLSTIAWVHFGYQRKAVILQRLLGQARIGWQQVLAQLGWGCILSIIALFNRENLVLTGAFVGVVAVAVADTWATEIGVLSRIKPRRLNDGVSVPAGTPGAISLLGILSGAAGAWLAGFTALLGYFIVVATGGQDWSNALLWLPISATLGGLVGSVVDSFLGATAQGMYFCEHCQLPSEDAVHSCGLPAKPMRGWPWLTTHGVDLAGSLVGTAVTMVCILLASV